MRSHSKAQRDKSTRRSPLVVDEECSEDQEEFFSVPEQENYEGSSPDEYESQSTFERRPSSSQHRSYPAPRGAGSYNPTEDRLRKALRRSQEEFADLRIKYNKLVDVDRERKREISILKSEVGNLKQRKLSEPENTRDPLEDAIELSKNPIRCFIGLYFPLAAHNILSVASPKQLVPGAVSDESRFNPQKDMRPDLDEIHLAELYHCLPSACRTVMFHTEFAKSAANTIKQIKSAIPDTLRKAAPIIFNLPEAVFNPTFDRSSVGHLRSLLSWKGEANVLDLYPPILFSREVRDHRDRSPKGHMHRLFMGPEIADATKVVLRGPSSLKSDKDNSQGVTYGDRWKMKKLEQLPGSTIPVYAFWVIFLASAEQKFTTVSKTIKVPNPNNPKKLEFVVWPVYLERLMNMRYLMFSSPEKKFVSSYAKLMSSFRKRVFNEDDDGETINVDDAGDFDIDDVEDALLNDDAADSLDEASNEDLWLIDRAAVSLDKAPMVSKSSDPFELFDDDVPNFPPVAPPSPPSPLKDFNEEEERYPISPLAPPLRPSPLSPARVRVSKSKTRGGPQLARELSLELESPPKSSVIGPAVVPDTPDLMNRHKYTRPPQQELRETASQGSPKVVPPRQQRKYLNPKVPPSSKAAALNTHSERTSNPQDPAGIVPIATAVPTLHSQTGKKRQKNVQFAPHSTPPHQKQDATSKKAGKSPLSEGIDPHREQPRPPAEDAGPAPDIDAVSNIANASEPVNAGRKLREK
ncbi:hypothetical protein H0H93_010138, partial [Arthromyces matolae]